MLIEIIKPSRIWFVFKLKSLQISTARDDLPTNWSWSCWQQSMGMCDGDISQPNLHDKVELERDTDEVTHTCAIMCRNYIGWYEAMKHWYFKNESMVFNTCFTLISFMTHHFKLHRHLCCSARRASCPVYVLLRSEERDETLSFLLKSRGKMLCLSWRTQATSGHQKPYLSSIPAIPKIENYRYDDN